VLWEITRGCNFRCRHCAQGGGPRRPNELSGDEALALCDDLIAWGVGSVCLMGGEPLVRPDWHRIARRLRDAAVPVGIVTNGWLLDDARLERVASLGVCQVCLSLDGATAAVHDDIRRRPGAFDRVLAALDRLAAAGVPDRKVITAVSRRNLAQLPAMLDLLLERADGFSWSVLVASVHDAERFDPMDALDPAEHVAVARFLKRARRRAGRRLRVEGSHGLGYCADGLGDRHLHDWEWRGCVAGIEALGIRSDGDVVGCLVLDDAFVEGNVRERPIDAIWRDPRTFGYTRGFRRSLLRGACRGCDFGAICRGGCVNRAVERFGRPFEAPVCLHRIERGAPR
jgi:radical SAM protein with 4Fe4S-binding SPASM domain